MDGKINSVQSSFTSKISSSETAVRTAMDIKISTLWRELHAVKGIATSKTNADRKH